MARTFPSPLRGEGQGEGQTVARTFPSSLWGEGQGEGQTVARTFPSSLRGEGQGEGQTMARTFPSPLWGEGQGEGKCEHGAKMWRRGGLTRCARPTGSPSAARPVCPTGFASCRTPVGGSHPPRSVHDIRKEPVRKYELFSKYGGEGGIDSLRSPYGQPVRCASGLSNWLRQLSNLGRGFSSPPVRGSHKKKARTCVQALYLNMAVRGGFEPPIRCRIHTFQACSFSHSDTSPYCLPVVVGTGANVCKTRTVVNELFNKLARLNKL